MSGRILVNISFLVFGFVAVAVLASTSFAKQAFVRSASAGAKSGVMKELRAAHHLLMQADHDYDGHRVKAAEEVHKAIMELEGKHQASVASTAAPAVAAHHVKAKSVSTKEKESQAVSDSQLKEALSILSNLQSKMGAGHAAVGGHISNAVGHLQTALRIR